MAFKKVWRGIDLSNHNGNIDFKKVKAAEIEFAILRTGYGRKDPEQYDTKFEEYYRQCKENNIPVGAYHFSYALTKEAALEEAKFMAEIVKGKTFEFPLYFDIETVNHTTLSKAVSAEIITTFCEYMEKQGFWAGVYSFDTFYFSNIPDSITKRFATWVARVENVQPSYCKNFGIWQNSWEGKIDGITGDVDLNYCYKDYPQLIKNSCMNGFGSKALYNVSALAEGLAESDAEALAKKCKELGMKTILKEV